MYDTLIQSRLIMFPEYGTYLISSVKYQPTLFHLFTGGFAFNFSTGNIRKVQLKSTLLHQNQRIVPGVFPGREKECASRQRDRYKV